MAGITRIGYRDRNRLRTSASTTVDPFPLDFAGSGQLPYTKDFVVGSTAGTPKIYTDSDGICFMSSALGTESHVVYTRFPIKDGWVETTTDKAQDSGLVLRWQDYNNLYLLALSDDSGTAPSTNVRLFKKVAGTFTNLGTFDTTWARGALKTVRLEAKGSAIKAYLDGTAVITATDSGVAGPGYFGFRSNEPNESSNFRSLRFGAL